MLTLALHLLSIPVGPKIQAAAKQVLFAKVNTKIKPFSFPLLLFQQFILADLKSKIEGKTSTSKQLQVIGYRFMEPKPPIPYSLKGLRYSEKKRKVSIFLRRLK